MKGTTRSFNSNNQETTGNAFLYDGAGNTTQLPNGNLAAPGVAAPTHKLIYNAQGQLAQLRDNNNVVIATYVYRGDGKRAWKELAGGQRSYFYYAGEMLIASTNGVDASSLQLWGADGLIGARTTNSTTGVTTKSYNLYDTQGNLAQIINARNGVVLGKSAVNAWGEPIRDANGNAAGAGYGAKFGYVRDGESGFYLCTLRYYDASGGRWLTRDPIGYAGGSNLYGYALNDSVNRVDPSGKIAPLIVGGIILGYFIYDTVSNPANAPTHQSSPPMQRNTDILLPFDLGNNYAVTGPNFFPFNRSFYGPSWASLPEIDRESTRVHERYHLDNPCDALDDYRIRELDAYTAERDWLLENSGRPGAQQAIKSANAQINGLNGMLQASPSKPRIPGYTR